MLGKTAGTVPITFMMYAKAKTGDGAALYKFKDGIVGAGVLSTPQLNVMGYKRPASIKRLRHWVRTADLSTVRGKAIDQLPQSERNGWRKLWADVAATLAPEPVVAPRPR